MFFRAKTEGKLHTEGLGHRLSLQPEKDVATMSSREISITITTHDGQLFWKDFKSAINDNINALKAVGRTLAGSQEQFNNWRVCSISMKSPVNVLLRYEPETDAEPPADWIQKFLDGMTELEKGISQPSGFSEDALGHVAKLINLRDRLESIEYSAPESERVKVSVKAATHAVEVHDALKKKRPQYYYSYGSIRGELGQITIHGATSEFAIYDQLTDRKIPCKFSPSHDAEVIARLLTMRIAVYGRIKYDRLDHPVSIDVETWKQLKSPGELASLHDIRNAMRPLPEGVSSEDFVRSLRDGS